MVPGENGPGERNVCIFDAFSAARVCPNLLFCMRLGLVPTCLADLVHPINWTMTLKLLYQLLEWSQRIKSGFEQSHLHHVFIPFGMIPEILTEVDFLV